MSAAIESNGTISVGVVVFVDPSDWAPPHLRGVEGTVVAVAGSEAQIQSSRSDELLWVNSTLLRLNRRRLRRPVLWETPSSTA